MSELAFLVDLLLHHKLPKATKDAIASRIKEVEASLVRATPAPQHQQSSPMPAQEHIARTPEAAAAMAKREEAIRIAHSGKPEAGRTSPRKF